MLNKKVLATIKNAPSTAACFNHLYQNIMVRNDGTFFKFVAFGSSCDNDREKWESMGYHFINVWQL